MTNPALARDDLVRAEKRLKAVDVLHADLARAMAREVVESAAPRVR